MKTNWIGLITLLAWGAATTSCHRSVKREASAPSPANPAVVAVVARQEISEEMLLTELRRRFGPAPAESVTVEQKLEALDRLVRQEAIYAQAKASGFDLSPEIQARIKNLVIAQFTEKRLMNTTPVVTEQELLAAYEASGSRFVQPAALRAAAIFVSQPLNATPEKKSESRARAEAILNEAQGGGEQAFARLATRTSEDAASRYRGGDLGWISRGSHGIEPAVVEVLERVEKPGGFAPLVETPRGYFIVKLVEKRESARKPLAEVKELLRHQLSREKAAQAERTFHAAMKAGLDIRIDRSRVERLSLPGHKNEPPRLPDVTMTRNP